MPEASKRVDIGHIHIFADVMRRHAADRPDAVALSFEGRETRYGELHRRTNRVARALRAAGFQPGQRVGYLGKNSDRYFELLFGAAKAGLVMVPIGWRLAPAEVETILKDAEIGIVFVAPDGAGQANHAIGQIGRTLVPVAIDGAAVNDAAAYDAWLGDPAIDGEV